MRFVVYGAGGIGGVIGARLFEHGHDVVLVARGAHHDAMRDRGLRIDSAAGSVTLPVPVVDHPDAIGLAGDDVVILAMKGQDTLGALRALAASAPPDVAVVCAQNGVENERAAARLFANVYGMCVMCPTGHLEPGVVVAYSSPISGVLDLGRYPAGADERAAVIAGALSASTFSSEPRADIMRWKYTKLLMNLGNSIEALCGPAARGGELYKMARAEGKAVLDAAGIDRASTEEDRARRGDLLQMTPIAGADRGGGSSWQSLARGAGAIETDYLNGEIVLLGRVHGVPTPVNETLQRLANDAAAQGLPPGSLSPDDVRAAIP